MRVYDGYMCACEYMYVCENYLCLHKHQQNKRKTNKKTSKNIHSREGGGRRT